jgi:drug/metabolite transporter (DMT)-like permease
MHVSKNMVSYELGITFGILAGVTNFLGQILQKKAINDIPPEKKNEGLMKILIKDKTWLSGIIIMIVFSTVCLFFAQQSVGAALIPGLMASGFIVLAFGSVFILKEKLGLKEILSIGMLLIAVILISLSKLSIEASMSYFDDGGFNIRIGIYSMIFLMLWLGLFFAGKKSTQFKSVLLALGTGFPFVLNNIWMGPMTASIGPALSGNGNATIWVVFIISAIVVVVVNVMGLGHYQYALEAGNASQVVPMQQLPQQVAPIIIYYFIYQFPSPTVYSLPLLIIGITLIMISGFILGSRQAALEKIKG